MSHVVKSQEEKVSPISSVSEGSRGGGLGCWGRKGEEVGVFFNP